MTSTNVERFRVLIIGSANAGKTTILEKVCHAQGCEPYFLDAEGNKIDSELKSSSERGMHDIENQIVYPTGHGFIFHDSRGFEAGSTEELVKVKEFISKRTKMSQMKDQLHAIWYCLPTSNDRPLTKAEMSLFESDTGNVPVIAVFTKMDALEKKAFSDQLNKKINLREAKKKASSLARDMFERDFLTPLKKLSHQPKKIVELCKMNEPDKNCNELVLKTAEALNSEALKLLIVSAQRNDVESSIKQVINEQIIPLAQVVFKGEAFSEKEQKSMLHGAMNLFSHSLPSFIQEIIMMDTKAVAAMRENIGETQFEKIRIEQIEIERRIEQSEQQEDQTQFRRAFAQRIKQAIWTVFDNQHLDKCFRIFTQFVPLMFSPTCLPVCQVVIVGTAIIFTLVHSLFNLTPLSRQTSTYYFLQNFELALDVYTCSFSLDHFIVVVENAFYLPDSMLEGDSDHLFRLIMAHPLIAEILSTN